MSNMNTNCNNAKGKGKHSTNKLEVNQNRKFQQEEFGSEFDFNAGSAQVKNPVETQSKTDRDKSLSERTAWN